MKKPIVDIQRFISQLRLFVAVAIRELEEGGLKLRAMSLVYTSLLSLAPLLAVSFSILKGFGVHNQIEPMLLHLLEPLGEKGAEITVNVIAFVENIQVGVLGFIGFLMLFYTVISLLGQIEACFNHIWRVTEPRPLKRRISDYLSVVLIGPVLVFSAVGITASMNNLALVQRLIAIEPLGTAYYLLGLLLPYLLLALAFGFAYSFLPNTKVKPVPALAGGLVAGVIWKISGMLFAKFIADSAQYSAIYSGFAVILVAMIWLYINWLILLLGSVLVFHVQYPHYLKYSTRRLQLSIQSQEQLAVLLLGLIAHEHVTGGQVLTLKDLADRVELPWEPVEAILNSLTSRGYLITLKDNEHSYVLASDSDAILLKDVVASIRNEGYRTEIARDSLRLGGSMQEVLATLEKYPEQTLQECSLRDIISIR
ncbi:MAG: YhjD/YihY/BrkB family envelope integrity protein [Gammaproteobacteria bacterium]